MPKDEPDLIKRVTQRLAIVEMENHHAKNWIGIAHIQESDNMVDALVYIKNKAFMIRDARTAADLKDRIRKTRMVIYVVTNDSLKFVWCGCISA